jgi:hypothetical protein
MSHIVEHAMTTAALDQVQATHRRPARLAQAVLCAGLLAAAAAAIGAEPAAGSTIEISSSSLPRFDNFDGSNRTQQRLDMALLSPGRSSFGVTMGVTGLSPSRGAFTPGADSTAGGVNLGLQYRYVFDNNRRVDITAWREMNRPNDALSMIPSREAGYGARVEMQLAGSRSPLVAERGFIGVQLDGGAKITLKRSGGRPMIYYRNQF